MQQDIETGPAATEGEPPHYEAHHRYGYDVVRNAVRLGWALVLIALLLNLGGFLLFQGKGFVVGAGAAVCSMACAYFVEGWRGYGCSWPGLYRICNAASPALTAWSHAVAFCGLYLGAA